jgi:hypothetical protein
MNTATASRKVFANDFAKVTAAIEAAGAVRTEADGGQWIDESRVSADILSAYRGLVEYGYANGLI